MAIFYPSFDSIPFTLEPMVSISSCPISSIPTIPVELELERKCPKFSSAYITHTAIAAVTSFPSFCSSITYATSNTCAT